jgi:hypothetical protein
VAEGVRLGSELREKVVEMFVRVEHLGILASAEGLSVFGTLCEMAGRCCTHLAAGRREQALMVARTIGRSVPHAFPVGREREALEDALEEIIAVLESPDVSHLH